MRELPAFNAAYMKYKDQVQFLNVSDATANPDGPAYVQQNGYEWLFADSSEALKLYRVSGIPTTLFISASGELVENHLGGMEQADLESKISQLL